MNGTCDRIFPDSAVMRTECIEIDSDVILEEMTSIFVSAHKLAIPFRSWNNVYHKRVIYPDLVWHWSNGCED